MKQSICYYEHEVKSIDNFVNFILNGKFIIHKRL